MTLHGPFFQVPIALFAIANVVIWLNAARIYKKMHPDQDFSLLTDQLFLFRKVDRSNPYAKRFLMWRKAFAGLIVLVILHGILFNCLSH